MATTVAELAETIARIARAMRAKSLGMPMPPHHVRALRCIAHESIRPARLAEALRITPRAVTDVVDAMIAADLITASPDPADRRAKVLAITPTGRLRLDEARARRDEAAGAMFAGLTADERDELARLLGKVDPEA